jgi:hypothetical protein
LQIKREAFSFVFSFSRKLNKSFIFLSMTHPRWAQEK